MRAADAAGNVDASPAGNTWTIDTTDPSSTLSFPGAIDYNNGSWNDFAGAASDTGGAALANVQISIQRVSNSLYWNGTDFTDGSENWRTATGTGSWSLAFAAANFPADDDYLVRYRAVDTAGNVETPASRAFTTDNANPQTTITSQPSDPTNSTSAAFDFSSDEPGSTFECQLDGAGYSSCTSPKSYSSLSQGSHTFDVRATDTAANVDASPATFTWTIDTTAPASVVSFPSSGSSYDDADWLNIAGTASDTGGAGLLRIEVSIRRVSSTLYWNGTAFADGSENWRTASGTASWSLAFAASNFPADGDYAVRVRAVDNANNTETATSYTVTIDNAAPNTTITAQPNDPTNSTALSFSFNSNEAGSTFECQLDGGGWSSCTSPKSYTGLSQGSHSFQVRATDTADNTDATPAGFSWTIDTTDPTSAFSFPAAGGFYHAGTWNDFSGTASDTGGAALANVQISIRRASDGLYWNGTDFTDSGENWRTATGTTSWSLAFPVVNFPADGSYTVRLRATDTATNVQAPISRSFEVDTAAPNTAVDSGPADPTNSTAPSFQFSADQPGSTFECQLDGGGWSSCVSPKSYTGVTQGSHTFQVRASDSAANTDPTPAQLTWTVDTTDPSSAISFPAASGIYRNAGWSDFSGSASDTGGAAVSGVQVSISQVSSGLYWDGSAFADGSENWRAATGTTSWSLAFAASNFPADGDYTVSVRATDSATNVQSAPVSRTFTIDNAAPNTTITAQPDDPTELDRSLLLLHLERGRLDLRVPARRRRLLLLRLAEELHRCGPGLAHL